MFIAMTQAPQSRLRDQARNVLRSFYTISGWALPQDHSDWLCTMLSRSDPSSSSDEEAKPDSAIFVVNSGMQKYDNARFSTDCQICYLTRPLVQQTESSSITHDDIHT